MSAYSKVEHSIEKKKRKESNRAVVALISGYYFKSSNFRKWFHQKVLKLYSIIVPGQRIHYFYDTELNFIEEI